MKYRFHDWTVARITSWIARPLASAISCSFAGLFLVGCSPARPASSDALTNEDRVAIRALDSTFVKAWVRDDTAAVLAVFSPSAVLLPPGSAPIAGLAGIRSYWWPEDGSHTRITSFARDIAEIEGTRQLAFVRGTAELGWTYEKAGKSAAQRSKSLDLILVAPDSSGRWHVIRQMWGTLP